MRRGLVIMAILLAMGQGVQAVSLTLEQVVSRARSSSAQAAVALCELRQAYWEYRTFRANLLPEVNFEATLPSYHKHYSSYMNSEGHYSFVRNNHMEMNGILSLSQKIWFTGGTLAVNSELDFLRQFEGSYNRYLTLPIVMTLNQPIFGVNTVKWDKKIEPLRYKEAKAAYVSQTEEVAMKAISYFFALISAREDLAIAQQNLDNSLMLHKAAVVKHEKGEITQNDLLQMELNVINAQSALTSAQSSLNNADFQLHSFLDIEDGEEIIPVLSSVVPQVVVGYDDALSQALDNNKFAKNQMRRRLEAEYAVATAKGNEREISLYGQVGLTGVGNKFVQGYKGLKDNQVVEVGVKIPIIDWGKRRGQVRIAQSNLQAVESTLKQEAQDFNHQIFILVERFNSQQQQLSLARRANEIAQQRYDNNVSTFLNGNLSTFDLKDSQVSKDTARNNYYNELYLYYYYYYQLRSVTLYDFSTRQPIEIPTEELTR